MSVATGKTFCETWAIKEKTIENLSVDFMHEKITEQCIQGLIKWKHRDPQQVSIKTLGTALRKRGLLRCASNLPGTTMNHISVTLILNIDSN